MPNAKIHLCQCPNCQQGNDHPDKETHRLMNVLLSRLDEQQRRWYTGLESLKLGHGGDRLLAQITGRDEKTIRRGRRELEASLEDRPKDRTRLPGGGRKLMEEKDPTLESDLQELVSDETAGTPENAQKWIRSSLRKVSNELKKLNHPISPPTVGRLLKKLKYSLKSNVKKNAGSEHPDRDEQFRYIESQKQKFLKAGLPVISVDTKKKELIGDFKNSGQTWCKEPELVNVHDFPGDATERAVPYGIYEITHNKGFLYVGTSADTPEFAVHAIKYWWKNIGKPEFPDADQLLILADSGGSNGYRPRAWKHQLQEQLSDTLGVSVTVCHYPRGCSKWNPIEHRLFSQISLNWAGKPFRTLEKMLAYIRGTTTSTGLKVKAFLCKEGYEKGKKVTEEEMKRILLARHPLCPSWNYTIVPRLKVTLP